MEHDDVGEPSAERGAGFERARRRRAVVDLGVALVDRQHEIVAPRQLDRLFQIVEAGDRALRVGRRAQVEQRGALQGLARDRRKVGHEVVVARRVEEHRVGAGHRRRAVVDEIVRVRHQHDRPGARLCGAAPPGWRTGTALPWCRPGWRCAGRDRARRAAADSAGSASRRWPGATPGCRPSAGTCSTHAHAPPASRRAAPAAGAAARPATSGSADR